MTSELLTKNDEFCKLFLNSASPGSINWKVLLSAG